MMKFQRGHLDESIEWLKLALDINKLYPSVWFTLGCAYIKKELYEKAIYAFGNVVSYDESHGEAWSNIASSYMQLSKPKEAQSSLEHVAKVWRSNWKIWENLIMLYLNGNQFMRVVSSIKQLIRLNKTDRVNAPLMIKVSSCFVNKYIKGNEAESSIARHKKILYDLFEQILSISPKNTGILKVFCRLMQSMDPNEYDKILDLKLREIRSIQSANWQYEIEERDKVTKTIQELKDFMGDRFESNEEVKWFVKNTLEVIEQTKK